MPWCCPPGHGCNAPDSGERCALELLRAAATSDEAAAAALTRWQILESPRTRRRGDGERRFRRRAFERLRDRALVNIAMRVSAAGRAERATPSSDSIDVRRLGAERLRQSLSA
jgi:hypothetical protein